MDAAFVKMVVALVPAVILMILDAWLRSRRVKDPTLLWLYAGLVSWALAAALSSHQLLGDAVTDLLRSQISRDISNKQAAEYIAYIFSPISSLLFTVAAFRLSRVREKFEAGPASVAKWSIIATVSILSAASLLMLGSVSLVDAAKVVDSIASVVAALSLGVGVTYSFIRYTNWPLAALSTITWLAILWRQIDSVTGGVPDEGPRLAIAIVSNMTLGVLFVALALAWGLSEVSRLTIVGEPQEVAVVAMFFDLRGSTHWSRHSDNVQVSRFMNELREWALKQCEVLSPIGRAPHLVKFLGDGYALIWEMEINRDVVRRAVDLACGLVLGYERWRNTLLAAGDYLSEPPKAIGAGLDFGRALRLTHENGSYDYIGEAVNLSAKFQSLARPNGGVVLSKGWWENLDEGRKVRFAKQTSLDLSPSERIDVRCMLPPVSTDANSDA